MLLIKNDFQEYYSIFETFESLKLGCLSAKVLQLPVLILNPNEQKSKRF